MSKEKNKSYKQKYTKLWESDPVLKDWLSPDPTDENAATCKYCRVTIQAHKRALVRHANTEKHKKIVSLNKSAKSCTPLTTVYKTILSEKTKVAELKIAAFIAEHTSLQTVDHMMEMIPQLDTSSEQLSNIKIHRTKCTMLIKNVLGPCMLQDLIEQIGNSPYSIIIDESTDLSTQKVLCVMLRFFSVKNENIVTTFYRLIRLTDCDAKSVYKAIKSQLEKDGLPLQNMVGIGVDGASVMVGKHNSVTALFKHDLPDLVVMKCVCHSLHLCAEKAAEALPRQLEFLIREAHNWFSYSPKRLDKYRDLYETINNSRNPKKIQGLSGTRWLARQAAIETILEQWDELKLLFSLARSQDKCYMAEQLSNIMSNLSLKAFLIFLKNELKNITQLNLTFQSDQVEPTKLLEDLFLLFKNLLQKIVVPAQLQKLDDSQLATFDFQSHLMHTGSVYFGYEFESIARTLEQTDLPDVRERCKNFLCTLGLEIQKRLPENIAVLMLMANLHPSIATSQMRPSLSNSLLGFCRNELFGNKNEIQSEWSQLQNKLWHNLNNSVQFYAEVYNDTDSGGNRRFENISKFALALLTIPISNACVERAFSIYAIIKNKLRNKLSIEMIQSIMMVRFTLQREHGNCVKFSPSPSMLKKFTVDMYDHKKQHAGCEARGDFTNDCDVILEMFN